MNKDEQVSSIRFDDASGRYVWRVELAGGGEVGGYSDTRSEAETLIQQYEQACRWAFRERGPRSPWGSS